MPPLARNPELGHWTVALTAVLSPVLLFPEVISVVAPAGMAAFAVGVFGVAVWLLHRGPSRWLTGAVAVLALSLLMGWALVPYRPEALSHLTGTALGALVMAVLAGWAVTPTRRIRAALVFLALGCAALLVGAAGVALPSPKLMSVTKLPELSLPLPGLGASVAVNPNALGITALLVLPLAVWLAMLPNPGRGQRSAGLALSVLAAALVFVTQSRSVWIAAAGLVGWVALRWNVERRVPGIHGAVAAVLVLCSVVAFGRIGWGLQSEGLHTVLVRLDIWRHAGTLLADSPLTGIGLQEFRYTVGTPFEVAHAHNILLQTWLDGGLGALFAWVTINAVVLRKADRATRSALHSLLTRQTARAGGLVVIAGLLFGILDAVSLGAKVGLLQWWASGLVLACAASDAEVSD